MLELRDITFGYDKADMLFEHLSLGIGCGERVALKAPSGFGKTTLCRIMAGYLSPETGAVLVDGEALPKKGTSPVQLIFQHPEIAVDPRMRMASALREAGPLDMRLAKRFGICEDWLSRFPHELSGGELQRFCIVRALMANPKYIIADEISTMLDPITQMQIWRALIEEVAERDMGLVFVSHSKQLTQLIATREIQLDAGK